MDFHNHFTGTISHIEYSFSFSTLQNTVDELHWQRLNRSLLRVSSTVDGKHDAVREIEVFTSEYIFILASIDNDKLWVDEEIY